MEQLSTSMQEAIMAAMAEEDEYLPSTSTEDFALDAAMLEDMLNDDSTESPAEVDGALQQLMQAVAENKRLKTEIEELKLTWEKHIERTLQKQGLDLPEQPSMAPPLNPPPNEDAPRISVSEKLKELQEENATLTLTQRNLKERWDATEALLLEEQARGAQQKKHHEWNLGFPGLGFARPNIGSLLGGIMKKDTHTKDTHSAPTAATVAPAASALPSSSSENPSQEDLEEEELPPVSIIVSSQEKSVIPSLLSASSSLLSSSSSSAASPTGFTIPTSLPVHHGPVDMLVRGFFGRSWKIYYFILYQNRVDCFYNINDAQAHIDYTGNKFGVRRKSQSHSVGRSSRRASRSSRRNSCNSSSDSNSSGNGCSGSSDTESNSVENNHVSSTNKSDNNSSSSSNTNGGSSSCSNSNNDNESDGNSVNSSESQGILDINSSANVSSESNDSSRQKENEVHEKKVSQASALEDEVDLAFLETSSVYLPPPEFCINLDQKGVSVRIENYQEHGVSFGRGFQLFLPSVSYHLCTEDVAATEKWLQVLSKAIYGDEIELDSETSENEK